MSGSFVGGALVGEKPGVCVSSPATSRVLTSVGVSSTSTTVVSSPVIGVVLVAPPPTSGTDSCNLRCLGIGWLWLIHRCYRDRHHFSFVGEKNTVSMIKDLVVCVFVEGLVSDGIADGSG